MWVGQLCQALRGCPEGGALSVSGENNEFSLAHAEFAVLLDNPIEMPTRDGYNNNNDYCIIIVY